MSKMLLRRLLESVVLISLLALAVMPAMAEPLPQDGDVPTAPLTESMKAFLADQVPAESREPMAATPCIDGMAGPYPCEGVDLMAHMPLNTIGGGNGNDIWGWTDPLNGREYALMGRSTGTAFVDITDPENPIYLGNLPTHTSSSSWRDIKVYADHAFIVSEASGHGMQVFDLTQLRNVASPPVTFSETAHYAGFGNAHNIVINEDSGFAYGVGTNTCSGGLHFVNIQNATAPVYAGCFSQDGYTHDAQCVNYQGPDPDHQGAEICFNANEDTVTIVDVTNKSTPVMLASTGYIGAYYSHQGWLSEDQTLFFLGDELDEINNGVNTTSYVWDVSDLDNPTVETTFLGPTAAIDHNMYVVGDRIFQANYRAGLRILDATNPLAMSEVAYFDIYPGSNSANFNGAWSVYPYFESGTIVVSGIGEGLFVLREAAVCHPGDLNCDCVVDVVDIAIAAGAWNCGDEDACYLREADLNRDGMVGIDDVMSVSGEWNWMCVP